MKVHLGQTFWGINICRWLLYNSKSQSDDEQIIYFIIYLFLVYLKLRTNKNIYYIPPNLFLYTINLNVPYERWISGVIFHGHGISQCNEIYLTFEWSNVMFAFLLDTENGENLSNQKKLGAGRKLKQNG